MAKVCKYDANILKEYQYLVRILGDTFSTAVKTSPSLHHQTSIGNHYVKKNRMDTSNKF